MKKLWAFFSNFFSKVFASARVVIRKYAVPAIEVVQLIKKIMDSQMPAQLAEITPTNFDDKIVAGIHKALPRAMIALNLVRCADNEMNTQLVVECAIDKLRVMHPNGQKAMYLNLAAMLTQSLSDGKLSWAEAVMAVQYWYEEHYSDQVGAAA